MREAVDYDDAPARRAGLAELAARERHPRRSTASTRARSCATSAPRARCAAGSSPADVPEARRASASPPSRAWSAATSRARSRSREPALRRRRRRAAIVALDTGIKRSIIRNFTARGATLEIHPCTTPRRRAAGARPRRLLPRPRPRRPGGARTTSSRTSARCCHQAGVRHLPRPPAALARRRAGDVQAARSATAAPTTRSRTCAPAGSRSPRQNHGFAVARQAGERRSSPSLGAAAAHAREPLRRHDRGHPAARRPGRLRPVPPGGRARARTTRLDLFDEFIELFDAMPAARRPPARSSCSAPARS